MLEVKKIKKSLLKHCADALELRHTSISQTMEDIVQSLQSETKSSAGDKHETGRAMLQLEREKTGKQLSEIEREKQLLSKVQIDNPSSVIKLGSIVITSQANYFIAISVGKITLENRTYFAISAAAPVAKLLLGKEEGAEVVFQHLKIKVQKVF
ncbi:3-oxoacyl-ACP synthase [Ascidiimonas sp. W6]|uniref:3-oxoacyl-ACP synthase n=1 Tax=Ascidiimonas meishanensis TaxID=3128903 RepID=UPI0030EE3947